MKLWKWITLLLFINVLGYGLVLYDMYDHKVDNVTFNGVGFNFYLGHFLIMGPGTMIFYVAGALLCIICPLKIRGLFFSVNTLFGAVLALMSMELGALTLNSNKIILFWFGFGVPLVMLVVTLTLGAMGKLRI